MNKTFITLLFLPYILFAQSGFIAHNGNPVMPYTQPNPGLWNDPSVLKVGSEYWMYATSPNGTAGPFDGNVVPYLLKSINGINWALFNSTPLLLNTPTPGSWDSVGVETPSVVYFNSLYHMYYTAVKGNGRYAIGHATSSDGQNWVKDGIVLTPSNIATDWKSYLVGEPGAVVYQNQVYLYFTGVGSRQDTSYPAGKSVIGLCTSSNGYTFTPAQQVLQQTTKYPAALGYYGYSTPAAVVIGNDIHLYYDVVNEIPSWTQVALQHSRSLNGVSGFIEDNAAIFHKNDFAWTNREIRSPSALLDSSRIKLWFAGDNFFNASTFGIGYAYSNITTSVSENDVVNADFTIFPNPSNTSVVFKFNKLSEQIREITILNNLGQDVIKIKTFDNEISLDLKELKPGIYYSSIVEGASISPRKKIVID